MKKFVTSLLAVVSCLVNSDSSADQKKSSQPLLTNELFNVYIPIKKVKITDKHRIITAEGILNGKIIGFSIEIPLNAEEIFNRNTLGFRKDEQVERLTEATKGNIKTTISVVKPQYTCRFISNGESTKNLFNALQIDIFNKVKPQVKFIFKNLFGNMSRINSNCESHDSSARIIYDSDPTLFALREGEPNDENIRFKLEATCKKNKLMNDQRELEFFINIIPSQKLLCFQEKDTANRNNWRYIFNESRHSEISQHF